MSLKPHEVAERVAVAQTGGDEIVSVLATTGEHAGERVIVSPSGLLHGTLGSPERDAEAVACARGVFASREPIHVNGLFAELHAPIEQLLIFGAGHIAVPLADLGARLGFHVTVLDDRSEFAHETRFAPDVNVRLLDLAAPFAGLSIDPLSYVVLVTRAHEHDYELLRTLLRGEHAPRYIGMIGSRRRVRAAFTALLADQVPREKLATIHAPIGLDIGAETPFEIALSIAAELVAVRRKGGARESLAGEERVLERFFQP